MEDKSDSIRDTFHLHTLNPAAASPIPVSDWRLQRSLGHDGPNQASLVSIMRSPAVAGLESNEFVSTPHSYQRPVRNIVIPGGTSLYRFRLVLSHNRDCSPPIS
jgi:hypothetical protein